MTLQDVVFSKPTKTPEVCAVAPVEIGPGKWLLCGMPGQGAWVVEGEAVTVRAGRNTQRVRAVVEDFWAARALSCLRQWRFENDRFGAVVVREWEVRRVLGSDGRWHVVAVRLTAQGLDCVEFCPDEVDFKVWLAHL